MFLWLLKLPMQPPPKFLLLACHRDLSCRFSSYLHSRCSLDTFLPKNTDVRMLENWTCQDLSLQQDPHIRGFVCPVFRTCVQLRHDKRIKRPLYVCQSLVYLLSTKHCIRESCPACKPYVHLNNQYMLPTFLLLYAGNGHDERFLCRIT